LKRCFINFEPNNELEKVTPWDFWENAESREEYPMSMDEWFKRASNTEDDVKWFFAEEVPKELLKDLSPRHQLKLPDQTWVYFSVWMGEGGATTAAHFDMDDNFYVQYYGRKRFLLFPPSDYKRWKSYPRVSPNHKQVQMEQNSTSRYSYRLTPDAPLPGAYEAILYPGDLLYIPAYWYHHVEAMISAPGTSMNGSTTETEYLSISSNFWSTKSMAFLIAQMKPLPFDPNSEGADNDEIMSLFPVDYPEDEMIPATRLVLLSLIADSVFRRGSIAAIAHQVTFLRYQDLFGPTEITTKICPPPVENMDALRNNLTPLAEIWAKGLKDLVRGAAELEMMNQVELMLVDVIETRNIYPFMYNCFEYTLGADPSAPTGFEK
jgi:hypothetical protein